MTELSNIFGSTQAEGVAKAPSASLHPCCGNAEPEIDPLLNEPYFGFPQKLERVCADNPDVHIDGYILFESHTDALGLFDAAKGEGYSVRISPTPRDARSSCGVALMVPVDQVTNVHDLAGQRGIRIENMVALPNQINATRNRYC